MLPMWRYNNAAQTAWTVAVVVVTAGAAMYAHSTPPSCPAGRPVDDIVAQARKEQSAKKQRNGDPSPQVTCSWGWCIDHSTTPPTFPEPAPRATVPSDNDSTSSATPSENISGETCGTAMKRALEAAHNVEVGDYSFGRRNYNGALMRYKDALEEKPEDVAIHVRLGRVYEKRGELPLAIEAYEAAQKLPRTEEWTDEAKSALLRLQHASGS
jgi:tetratricopeptide (TPR) repeat protein